MAQVSCCCFADIFRYERCVSSLLTLARLSLLTPFPPRQPDHLLSVNRDQARVKERIQKIMLTPPESEWPTLIIWRNNFLYHRPEHEPFTWASPCAWAEGKELCIETTTRSSLHKGHQRSAKRRAELTWRDQQTSAAFSQSRSEPRLVVHSPPA